MREPIERLLASTGHTKRRQFVRKVVLSKLSQALDPNTPWTLQSEIDLREVNPFEVVMVDTGNARFAYCLAKPGYETSHIPTSEFLSDVKSPLRFEYGSVGLLAIKSKDRRTFHRVVLEGSVNERGGLYAHLLLPGNNLQFAQRTRTGEKKFISDNPIQTLARL